MLRVVRFLNKIVNKLKAKQGPHHNSKKGKAMTMTPRDLSNQLEDEHHQPNIVSMLF